MLLDRESCVKEALNFGLTVIKLILGNPFRVNTRFIDHPTGGMLEVCIVFEEVRMPEDMSSHKGILQQIVHIHQEGITWISVDDHFINLAQPKIILHLLSMIGFTMSPMAEAAR